MTHDGEYRKRTYRGEVGKDFSTGARQRLPSQEELETVGVDWLEVYRDSPAPSSARTFSVPRRWADIVHAVRAGEFTWDELAERLDPDELGNKRIRVDGVLVRLPGYVPQEFLSACQREMVRRGSGAFESALSGAIQALTQIAVSSSAKDADRIKAASLIIERVMGKTPDKVEMTVKEDPWQTMLSGIVAEDPSEAEAISRAHDYLERQGGASEG